jgi:hypothetical protein
MFERLEINIPEGNPKVMGKEEVKYLYHTTATTTYTICTQHVRLRELTLSEKCKFGRRFE